MTQTKKKINPVLKAYTVSAVVFAIILIIVIFLKAVSC